jgi:hypothetical protein
MSRSAVPFWLGLLLAAAPAAHAGPDYPSNACVGQKLRATSALCKDVFKAWATFERTGDAFQRDRSIAKARVKHASAWAKADARALLDGVPCDETTGPSTGVEELILDGATALVTAVNDGLDLDQKPHQKCATKIVSGAAQKCQALVAAHAAYVRDPAKDADEVKRDARIAKGREKFDAAYAKAIARDCPTSASGPEVEAAIDDLVEAAVERQVMSPNVPTEWTPVTPPSEVPYLGKTLRPICSRGTPYTFFVKRGTVNKLLVYFQGGGACFSWFTCQPGVGAFDEDVTPGDNPGLDTHGFADLSNPDNPFKDWNAVFVSYCTADVHWGDATYTHQAGPNSVTINHRGAVNSFVVEKWAREHFVAPEQVFVTGSSAGAYGAIVGGAYLRERTYPGAHFDILGDAGNGVITQEFLANQIANWGVLENLPAWIPALNKPLTELSIDQLWSAVASTYPSDRFAQYTSAWDGGLGSQTFFYQVMLHPTMIAQWFSWWQASCEWNQKMREFGVAAAAAAPNYRYYVGAGSRHTIWGSDKVYTDTKGGVPLFVDWVNAMLGGTPAWVNVQCTDCSLLPGACSAGSDTPDATCQDDVDCPNGTCEGEDVRPEPLAAPFGPGGAVTCP